MRAPFRSLVISGASSGLGAALARAYAGPEVALALIGRDAMRLAAVADACRAADATVEAEAIDVVDCSRLACWLADFDQAHPVELAIANAGISAGLEPDGGAETAETTSRQIAVNLLGAVNLVAPLVPAMEARGRGRIAFIASLAAYRGLPYAPGYCASKAGLRAYGEALRALVEPRGIGVTVVCPGFFASRMTDRWDGAKPLLMSGEAAARKVKCGIDRGRRRIDFPWPLALGMRFYDALPAAVGDRLARGLRFRIRPV